MGISHAFRRVGVGGGGGGGRPISWMVACHGLSDVFPSAAIFHKLGARQKPGFSAHAPKSFFILLLNADGGKVQQKMNL